MGKKKRAGDSGVRAATRVAATDVPYDVRIRMYRQGLGDCFLLSFQRAGDRAFHAVIDCGVLNGSPAGAARLRQAVEDIIWETEGRVDLLIATHEHADHLSGFNLARSLWEKAKIAKVWLGWTEDEDDPAVTDLKRRRQVRLRAAAAGVLRMQSMATDASPALLEKAESVRDLLGLSFEDDDDLVALAAGEGGAAITGPARALDWLKRESGALVEYCRPGDEPRNLTDEASVRVFVLGPPEGAAIRRSDPLAGEAYLMFGEQLSGDLCFGLAAGVGSALGTSDAERAARPFDELYQLDRPRIQGSQHSAFAAFFAEHYGFSHDDENRWRRIETDWLGQAEGMALALAGHVNNTSLVLAFELGDGGPVLLFPGDAQAGSWSTWRDLSWSVPSHDDKADRVVTGADLLRRTAFLKVGHHGSHNATMRGAGLELMTRPDLVAFIPVHRATARRRRPEWKMPWEPLWERLREKTEHRVLLSDHDEPIERQLESAAEKIEGSRAKQRWDSFKRRLSWDESPERLWVEYRYSRSGL